MMQPTALALLAALLVPAPAAARPQDMQYGGNPDVLGRDTPRLGAWVPDLEFEGADGKRGRLSEVAGKKGLVIALRDKDCPLSKRFGPRTRRLEAELEEDGFGLLLLGVQSAEACLEDAKEHGFGARYAADPDGELAARLAARTTTEVFVLDAARTLAYRGMIDDQYGLGFVREEPQNEYLVDALRSVRWGSKVKVPATQSHGCLLELEPRPLHDGPVTYHEQVRRIVQAKCESCHREGEAAPFTLGDYESVKKRRRMIAFVVEDGIMPPWHAEPGSGPWANDLSLSAEEKDALLAWAQGDAPEGDPANAPRPVAWAEGWKIGEPDYVVEMPREFRVPAEGTIDYQHFSTTIDLEEDRWVSAVEIRPSAVEVVHHVILYVNEPGKPRRFDGARGFFAATAPGQIPIVFPLGLGKRLPAGAELTFEMHYTANGTAQVDRTIVGFQFSDEPLIPVETSSALNQRFEIPPGAFDYEVAGEFRFPEDGKLLTLFPHTHLRGVRFQFDVQYPDGKTLAVLPLTNYDFNWQLNYDLLHPLEMPKGTVLRATAWYDNSEGNPANPDPTATVRFGEQTWDEMMIGYFNWVPDRAVAVETGAPSSGAGSGRSGR